MNSLKTSRPEAPIAILTPTSRTRSFERRELDVHVHHPAADERQDAGEHEDHVVDVALAPPLPHARAMSSMPEVLLLAVVRLRGAPRGPR